MRSKLVVAAVAVTMLFSMAAAHAATSTERVDANGDAGWIFNPDPSTATPYEFTTDDQSIGGGSLYVPPISATAADKFIAWLQPGTLVSELQSLAYDFKVAGASGPTSYKQFYLNLYVDVAGSTAYYDCRFDYVPSTGSTSSWTTALFSPSSTPSNVRKGSGYAGPCPTTLGGMPPGSYVAGVAINLGDTSVSDSGLAGYFDNVVLSTDSGTTVYDFEATPSTSDACKKGGWATYGFSNQGECVSTVKANPHAGK